MGIQHSPVLRLFVYIERIVASLSFSHALCHHDMSEQINDGKEDDLSTI